MKKKLNLATTVYTGYFKLVNKELSRLSRNLGNDNKDKRTKSRATYALDLLRKLKKHELQCAFDLKNEYELSDRLEDQLKDIQLRNWELIRKIHERCRKYDSTIEELDEVKFAEGCGVMGSVKTWQQQVHLIIMNPIQWKLIYNQTSMIMKASFKMMKLP